MINHPYPHRYIVGALLRAEVEGECLTEEEFRYFMLLLIVAGNETTRTATNHGLRLLMEHPEQYQLLGLLFFAIFMIVDFVLQWSYFVLCELAMQGRSPGKAIFGLNVGE